MKKFFRTLLFLLLLGGLAFAVWKFRLIPHFQRRPVPTGSPAPESVQRDVLRVAVASRPEKLLMTSLKRLLEVEHLQLEVVEYNPDTVWLQLASQDLDLVIVPVGEAVQGQGRFDAGRWLFFTGESEGLDKLWAQTKVEQPKRVGVYRQAASEFLARQMLPEAKVVPAKSLKEVEEWLTSGAVDAALLDMSSSSDGLDKKFRLLTATSEQNPMPTVAVLSRDFAENADSKAYSTRRKVLESASQSWAGLVSYLDTQPELLKSALKKEADEAGVDLDEMLAGYRFLSPAEGRTALEKFHESGFLKRTLDLLVLSGAGNLRNPDWVSAVGLPPALKSLVSAGNPTPVEATPSPSPSTVVTPTATPSVETPPEVLQPSPSLEAQVDATHTYPRSKVAQAWPEPLLTFKAGKVSHFSPALSNKQVAVASETNVVVHEIGTGQITVPLTSPLTTPVIFDGQNFILAAEGAVWAVNSQGKEVWRVETQGTPRAADQLLDGKVYFSVDNDKDSQLLCLDKVDGELLWSLKLDSPPSTRPVLALGDSPLLLVSTQNGDLRAYNGVNGQIIWSQKLSEPLYIEPSAGYGKIGLTRANGNVTLLKTSDGTKAWDVDLGTGLIAPPTLTPQGVLIPSKDTYLYHLSHQNGEITWKTRIAQTMSEPATVVGGQVVQSDESGNMHILELVTGTLLETNKVGGSWLSPVRVLDKRWAVVDDSGTCRVYQGQPG